MASVFPPVCCQDRYFPPANAFITSAKWSKTTESSFIKSSTIADIWPGWIF